MDYKEKISILLIIFVFSLFGEEVMKITLTKDISHEKLGFISKIIFEDNNMIAGSSYNLDEIMKIEFFEDAPTNISKPIFSKTATNLINKEQIGFTVKASTLSLSLPIISNLSVSVFSLNGRKVAELFNGNAPQGVINLDLKKYSLATGIYSVLVKSKNTLFVRKLIIK